MVPAARPCCQDAYADLTYGNDAPCLPRLPRWAVILYVNVIAFATESYSCSHCTGFCLARSAYKIPSRHLSWRFNVVYYYIDWFTNTADRWDICQTALP